jgi:hypothetical protein
LRREQGWSPAFTSRVLAEYRRFLFITATHEDLMVPSEAVDQAWHLHMLDTRAYWDELCGRVAGRPIHHTPSRGGAPEDRRHADAYEATLACYREAFGEAPPADVWPSAPERFAGLYRRVDTRETWIVRKGFVKAAAIGCGSALVLGGCATETFGAAMAAVVVGVVALIALAAVAAAHQQPQARERKDERGGCGGVGSSCGGGANCGDGGSGCGGGGGGCGGGCG